MDVPQLLFYSHVPTVVIGLLVGFFVFFKNRQDISAKILFYLTLLFSVWSLLDIITWMSHDGRLISLSWIFIYLFEALVFAYSLYFVYVFVKQKDASLTKKIIVALFLLPIIIFGSSKYSVEYFDIASCEPIQGNLIYYLYFFEIIFSVFIITFLIKSYIQSVEESRKKILYLSVGIILFLLAFSWTNIVGNLTTNWEITQYGLFGMPVFMAFLAYLIVRYKAFNIKLIGAQALVVSLIILVGSQFFFIQNNTNRILTGVTLALIIGFGWILIKSIRLEVQRKEQLQEMSDKLAQANDQLRTLDNAKSEFISIASHQLRTPLTAIKGFISLLLEGSYGKIDEKPKDIINKVYQSNERLIDLVEDLLSLSRIESGRMEYKFEKVKMEDVCQEVYDTFVIRAKERNLDFDFVLPKKPLTEAMTDRLKIREIVSNLVDNAIKYTPKGGVKLKVTKEKEGIRVAVTDTGIGVPEEEKPYLFSKFSRGKDITRLNTGGTGLGLHVGKRMIEDLHGKLWVESKGEGRGSTFFVEVPFEVSDKE